MKKFRIKVDGVLHEVEVEEVGGSSAENKIEVANNVVSPSKLQINEEPKSNAKVGAGSVVAPLQGTLQTLKVKVGDSVNSGDVVAVIEAMKMENDIPATSSGKVLAIHVSVGAKVSSGDVIMDIG